MSNQSQRRVSSLGQLGPAILGRLGGGGDLIKIPVGSIQPNSQQVRHEFDENKIKELAMSIEAHGLLEPVVVRKIESPTVGLSSDGGEEKYELVAGERRLRAYQFLNKPTIPAVVRVVEDKDMRVLALVENIQREDLSIVEKGLAIQDLKKQFGSIDSVLPTLGISRSAAFMYARVGEAEEKYQSFIRKNQLDVRASETLLSLIDRVKKSGDPKKLASFNQRLFDTPYSPALLLSLAGEFEIEKGKTSGGSKIAGAKKDGFWENKSEHGLNLRFKKGEKLAKKDQDTIVRQIKQFLTANGARKVMIEF